LVVIVSRRNANRERAYEQLNKLKDSLLLQQFMQDCDDVSIMSLAEIKTQFYNL
jgi:hypothetical protein